MDIVLDSYLFDIEDEDEIRINIPVYNALINVCKSGHANVYLYNDTLSKMLERDIKPFPIQVWKIKDKNLKNAIINMNSAFNNAVMSSLVPLDIDDCGGEQDFFVDADDYDMITQIRKDRHYTDLIFLLLHSCYNKNMCLSNRIVTGELKRGRKIGDEFTLSCRCVKEYKERFRFCSIEEFQSDQDKAFIELQRMKKEGLILYEENPIVVRGKHHNKLQFDSNFTTFSGLSRGNKAVISLLRNFGLKKIIFGEFHEDTAYPKGTIHTYSCTPSHDGDVLKGWLFAETGYRNHVDLLFPQKVGENLMLYFNSIFLRTNVGRLVESIMD